jgi:membrane dipeptidase
LDVDTIADLQKLAGLFTARGYSTSDIAAIFQGNFLRFLQQALPE